MFTTWKVNMNTHNNLITVSQVLRATHVIDRFEPGPQRWSNCPPHRRGWKPTHVHWPSVSACKPTVPHRQLSSCRLQIWRLNRAKCNSCSLISATNQRREGEWVGQMRVCVKGRIWFNSQTGCHSPATRHWWVIVLWWLWQLEKSDGLRKPSLSVQNFVWWFWCLNMSEDIKVVFKCENKSRFFF